jgi:2'-5' RNA ligase
MRLFVALSIPEETRSSLAALVSRLRPSCRTARWVRMEGVHITLKFIGETPAEKLQGIRASLASIPRRDPIALKFRGLAFFPDARRPRVLWAGIESGAGLAVLAEAVEASLAALGIAPEARKFSPHLTLARFSSPRGLDHLQAAIEKAGALEFGGATAQEFHLYQSVLKPGGAEYTQLATYSFAGREAE